MKPSVLIFDVYKTLLRVSPPVADAPAHWESLWKDCLGGKAELSLTAFGEQCRREIDRVHAEARKRGVDYPEVLWEEIVKAVLPQCRDLPAATFDRFIAGQALTWHQVNLDAACLPVLAGASERGLPLGIASNAQRYTHWELERCLGGAGLQLGLFEPRLCFWSFENGYSKPSERVFKLLSERAGQLGFAPGALMMIGDRADNDIEPALAQGWQVWHLRAPAQTSRYPGGTWEELRRHLFG